MVSERIVVCTKLRVGLEQCGFISRGCVNQVLALKNEKYLERDSYGEFICLKVYDRVNRGVLWKVLQMYGINEVLLNVEIFFIKTVRHIYEKEDRSLSWIDVTKAVQSVKDRVAREVNVWGRLTLCLGLGGRGGKSVAVCR